MSVTTVLAVIIEHIATSNALDSLTHGLSALTYQQMQMVWHQAIGIISTIAPAWCPFVVVTKTHSVECRDELEIVLFIIKYLLVVDTTYHHMVNTRSRLLSWLSRHIFCFYDLNLALYLRCKNNKNPKQSHHYSRKSAHFLYIIGAAHRAAISNLWRIPKGHRLESHTNARLCRLLPKGRKNFDGEVFPS